MSAPTDLLYAGDAYRREFAARVVAADPERGAVALSATAFFPGGGGQPADTGSLACEGAELRVTGARAQAGVVWHLVEGELPEPGAPVAGAIDWERRHLLMRVHTALHLVNGVLWLAHGVQVTGARVGAGEGRADFDLASMSADLGREVEERVNERVERDHPIVTTLVPRAEADRDPSLIRSKANLIPAAIDPLRVVDIVGLDRQACSGTHVRSTAEVGPVRVVRTESKGRDNKRVRIALD